MLMNELEKLERAPKPIIAWQTPPDYWSPRHMMRPILEELARITGRVTVDLAIARRNDAAYWLELARNIALEQDARISLAAQPFSGPNREGDVFNESEINEAHERFYQGLTIALTMIPASLVREVLVDNERFVKRLGVGSVRWNEHLEAVHNRFYETSKEHLPNATYSLWESRACWPQPNNLEKPWRWSDWTTGREKSEISDVTLWTLPNETGMREAIQAVKAASKNRIMAWVDLGCGVRQTPGGSGYRDTCWDYPSEIAWWAGWWLAHEPRVTRIGIIAPPPQDELHPYWGHLIAFVKGMNNQAE